MKSKLFTLILLTAISISFIFSGCGGSKIERTVQDDNIFYSSNRPKIKIKINPDFKFVEGTEDKDFGSNEISGERSSNAKINNYFFQSRISGKLRAVSITISELTTPGWYFQPKIFNEKNELDSGRIKIQGKTYQYCIFTVARPNNDLLVRAIGRISGADQNCMIKIGYLEQVTGDWSNIDLLTADQQRLLNEFVEDSKKDIQILE
jgi:hypothetical protein